MRDSARGLREAWYGSSFKRSETIHELTTRAAVANVHFAAKATVDREDLVETVHSSPVT